ncbi:MAG: FAD-binding protein [Deltaproteobacteria bacterium]|nr:FAD-binding protein [Deltaproteobacteria bacterium]
MSLLPLNGPDDQRLSELAATVDVQRDPEELALLAGDESVVQPVVPGAAVMARSVEDVAATMRWAHTHGVPVTPRGAGSGKAGGCVPTPGGLVLSLAPMTAITVVHPEHGYAEVEPGVITETFRDSMEHEHRLFYPPDPASLDWCTLGGNVATNAGGPVALKYGVTGQHVMGLTLVLADGRVIETGRRQPKDVAGYDLTSQIVGSEGTLAVIVGVRLGLLPIPREVRTALLGFSSMGEAASALVDARRAGVLPRAMEVVDPVALQRVRSTWEHEGSPFGVDEATNALLLVEVDGPEGTTEAALQAMLDGMRSGPNSVREASSAAERGALWATRREMSKRVKRGALGWVTEDIAVPLGTMPSVTAELADIGARHDLTIACYGHIGDGNLHVNVLWETEAGAGQASAAVDDVMALALRVGGTVTGEHGIGRAKTKWLEDRLGAPALALQRSLKSAWDPRGILNPGVAL